MAVVSAFFTALVTILSMSPRMEGFSVCWAWVIAGYLRHHLPAPLGHDAALVCTQQDVQYTL
ncbi:hypothetical protein DPMN_075552 [Dreissena polymorpha]|uniref:Uncharacterized protein n=1 Tax=Dreissena polymorpha TaxID=45954 RepID=A0A9D3YLX1_DREPO|nr:hypothetical protein DPMN_075552 [Dreissena polymorpha]